MDKKEFDSFIQGLIDDGFTYEYLANRLDPSGWKNMKNPPRIEDEIYSALLVEMFNLNGADISFDSDNKFIIDSDKDDKFENALETVKKKFKINKNSRVIPNKSGLHRWLERKDIKPNEDRLKFIAELGDEKMKQKTLELLTLLEKEGIHVAPGNLVEFIQKLLTLLEKEGFNVSPGNLVEFIQSEEGRMFFESIKNK